MKKNEDAKIKILVIEDDPFLGEMYVEKLTKEGFETEVATDGEAGMNKIKEARPDLVLLDVILPKMDGWEVLKKVKDDPDLNSIPIILLTNLGQKSEVEKGLALGASDYVVKAHFTPTAVVARVRKVISQIKNNKE